MGLIAGITGLTGGGDVSAPSIKGVGKDYLGLLDAYGKGAGKLFDTNAEFAPKYADLMAGELGRLAPGALKTIQDSSPERTALLKKMLAAANGSDLNYGAALPPELLRLTQQSTRTGQAARGMGYGPSDLYQETGDAARLSTDLTDRNRAFAQNAAGASYSMESDPFLRLLGLESGASQGAMLTPANSLSLMQMPYQGRMQANSETAKNFTGLMTTASEGFDSFAGSAMGMI